jgi:hypothetical protein
MAKILNLNKNENYELNNFNNIQYVDENLKACIMNIKDIGDCLEIPGNDDNEINNKNNLNIESNNDLKDLKGYIYHVKEIMKCLENKERLVNEYTSKINDIIKNGNYKDKQILLNLLGKMKRDNKFKKIINIKNKREELSNEKRLNEIKRSQKYVLFRKKIFIDVPLKIKHNKTSKVNLKENNDYDYLCYSSEESEENEKDKK